MPLQAPKANLPTDSLFAEMAKQQNLIDCAHRDGGLVRLLVDNLRKGQASGQAVFCPPEEFDEWRQLIAEAKYWRLQNLEEIITSAAKAANTISVGYHGTLAVGKQGHAGLDINFRRIHRILISGKAWACRQVFGRSLNETRDGNMDSSRYTSRFYLTHTFLEQAFDVLAAHRYKLVSSTSNNPNVTTTSSAMGGAGSKRGVSAGGGSHSMNKTMNDPELRFLHYSQFMFVKYS